MILTGQSIYGIICMIQGHLQGQKVNSKVKNKIKNSFPKNINSKNLFMCDFDWMIKFWTNFDD